MISIYYVLNLVKAQRTVFFNYQLGVDLNHESGTGKRILDKRQELGDYAAFFECKT